MKKIKTESGYFFIVEIPKETSKAELFEKNAEFILQLTPPFGSKNPKFIKLPKNGRYKLICTTNNCTEIHKLIIIGQEKNSRTSTIYTVSDVLIKEGLSKNYAYAFLQII